MDMTGLRHIYGPVRSRRLGRSLGIDLVPFKTCCYDCIYCQLGRTTKKSIDRKEYVPVSEVLDELERALAMVTAPDYIGIAGSGEPTLHSRLGELITEIKRITAVPVAVLTNGSILWMPEVRKDLAKADLVLPSLDAPDEHLFLRVNRPHEDISFDRMLGGLIAFTEGFRGAVWLEILLLAGITGAPTQVERLAAVARRIRAERIQLNTVSRPPAETHALAVPCSLMEQFKGYFGENAEVISESDRVQPQASSVEVTKDVDILALLRRSPCTVEGLSSGLGVHAGEVVKRLDALRRRGAVRLVKIDGAAFYEVVRTE
jgi:wyosine [tRNA(Phe)-imidazoG37] synthetase (radical SAM superfamily)